MSKQLLNRGARSLVMVATLVLGVTLNSVAQAQTESPAIFENVTLSPKSPPESVTVRGISGGDLPAKNIAGRSDTPNGPCVGFVDDKPNHTMVLTEFFDYLKLQVQSPGDTTMVISGPGGTWCNDDFQGKNPGMVGQWLAGKYNIWIGSYDKTRYLPYKLEINKVR